MKGAQTHWLSHVCSRQKGKLTVVSANAGGCQGLTAEWFRFPGPCPGRPPSAPAPRPHRPRAPRLLQCASSLQSSQSLCPLHCSFPGTQSPLAHRKLSPPPQSAGKEGQGDHVRISPFPLKIRRNKEQQENPPCSSRFVSKSPHRVFLGPSRTLVVKLPGKDTNKCLPEKSKRKLPRGLAA